MATPQPSAGAEWRAHWPLVLAATAGFSFHSIGTYTTGLFMEPLSQEFGWSRAQIAAGLTIAALLTVPLSPFVGALIDRWGARRLALPGLVLTAVAVAGFSLANGSIAHWLGLWTFYAVVATGVKSTVWTAAVTGLFTAARGLALGVTMCGAAVAQVVAPPVANWIISNHGWRTAYVWLGLGWGGAALLLALFFLFDAHDEARRDSASKTAAAEARALLPGLGVGEALRDPALIRIAISTLITMFLGVAMVVHQVPILRESGVARSEAALLASLAGLAGVAGKLATGWMTDRWNAGLVGGITLASPVIAFFLLLAPFRTPALIIVAMVIIGYAGGAKLQICGFLASRYAGMRNFGKIFGVMASLIAVGSGVGPMAAGATFDSFGSYTPFLLAGIPGSLICGLLIFGLGPYPSWETPQPARQASQPEH